MLSNTIRIVSAFFAVALLSVSGAYSDTVFPDNIEMNTPEYKKHTKGLVSFNHKKHTTDYKAKCGECHHDTNNTPLDLKEGDSVDRCIACHSKTGKKPKEEKLSKKDMIKNYHKSAIHASCKKCHRNFNKTNNFNKGDTGAAPQDCKECHPSNK